MLSITTDEFGWGCAIPGAFELRKNTLHTEKKTTPKMIQPAVCCLPDRDPLAKPSKNTKVTITRSEMSIVTVSGISIITGGAAYNTVLRIQISWKILKKA
jgi:hypothetical protein